MPTLPPPRAGDVRQGFTVQYSSRVREIVTPVGISAPYGPGLSDASSVRVKTFSGVWDTGATCSVVSQRIVDELMLRPIDRAVAETASGSYNACGYLVAIYLPNGVVFPAIRVIDSPAIGGGADALIGMDIIGDGDLAITNVDGRTCMSFQLPSSRRIDFMADLAGADR